MKIAIIISWFLMVVLITRNKLTEIDRDYYKELLEIYRNAWNKFDDFLDEILGEEE